MKGDKKDIPQFQKDVCLKTCIMKGSCIEKKESKEHFLACPHYFNWKLGLYPNFVEQQLIWEREHPEEARAKYNEAVKRAKQYKNEQAKRTKDTSKRSKS